MQLNLHTLSQQQGNGYSDTYTEPDFKAQSILIRVTAISVDLLGNIVFRLQHSPDDSNWSDVPSLATGNISTTGTTSITRDPAFACFDHMRLAWTFTNANSVTFYGAVLGVK